MKIIACHCYYRVPGGEDQVFEDEVSLLRSMGHEVIEFTAHNDALADQSQLQQFRSTLWNAKTHRDLSRLIETEQPDLVHVHNTFPLLSPSVVHAAHASGTPVVATLHNYRLLCPAASLMRAGEPCHKCVGKSFPVAAIKHKCYRGSRPATAAVAGMTWLHSALQTWSTKVTRFIALTETSKRVFVDAGFPEDRIDVKPNMVLPDPGYHPDDDGYVAFVGRLSHEKGVQSLLDAWTQLDSAIPLKIIGTGVLDEVVREAALRDPRIEWLQSRPFDETIQTISRARLLVVPSVWQEPFGRTVIEGLATGTPVVTTGLGGIGDLIEDGKTALTFRPGDAADLVANVQRAWSDKSLRASLQRAGREHFEQHFSASSNYERLRAIYSDVLNSCPQRASFAANGPKGGLT